MNRCRLERLLLALSNLTHARELVVIGSQAIHALPDDVPAEVLIPRECDVLLDRELADLAITRARIAAVPDLHMRAVLAARLQIVLEGAPR